MTQKQQQSESSESEDEGTVGVVKSENPWLGSKEAGDPLDQIFSGYKKFWEDHNSNQKEVTKVKQGLKEVKAKKMKIPEPAFKSESEDESEDEDNSESDSDNEDSSKFINDLFDEAEEKINIKMQSKLAKLKPKLLEDNASKKKISKKKRKGANVHDANYLGFAKKAKLGDVDQALNEDEDDEEVGAHKRNKSLLSEVKLRKEEKNKMFKGNEINPDSFLSVKSKHLITAVPKSQDYDEADNEYDVKQLSMANKLSLAEAFENDDIINDFEEEVENENKKLNPVESVVPGWGSWGGHGVKTRAPKIVNKVPAFKKKDRVIINAAPNEKLQKHLISSVPFPFKSVEDFEASMRLPIGKDFVPESAHRKLVMPGIVTKAGTIIEPMNEDILVQKGPTTKSKFMKRGKKPKTKKIKK